VAMASDINGFSWGIADVLVEVGVKYLITNLNSHHGGAPIGEPLKPFYWFSPKWRKILVWNGIAYHKANLLGLIPGFCPRADPGISGMVTENNDGFTYVEDISFAETRVYQMVKGLIESGYQYNFIPIMGGANYTDNNPAADGYCDLIQQWNDTQGHEIHIRTSSVEEFFEYMEKNDSCNQYQQDIILQI